MRLVRKWLAIGLVAAACLGLTAALVAAATCDEEGFDRLFDGKTLKGWILVDGSGPGYVVRDGGVLACPSDGGGRLFTAREYSDFIFRFEFRTEPGGNNGVGIRSAFEGDPAYDAMEVQILDDSAPEYATLEPGQYCGSVYKVFPAKRGSLKKAGEWNQEEITAIGRHITVRINGKTVVDGNLNTVQDPATLAEHPGFIRDRGHIGFLGHGPAEVEFRNIRVKDLSRPQRDNVPPDGFKALFDGRDLKGWKGLVASPPERAKMSKDEMAAAQKDADNLMRAHWKVVDGVLIYDGKGNSLCTGKDYANFEMLVDWKIEPGGDSGIYLRGAPQVQIWDNPLGSGGLYNNQQNPSNPTRKVDNAPGKWNRFRILMVGDKVTVYLNGVRVVTNVPMENYWERDKPIYPSGQIELQHHNSVLYFKNVFIREIK